VKLEETDIPDVKLIRPHRHGDDRGWFMETYDQKAFKEIGIEVNFVQDATSMSPSKGCVRGLHFQAVPFVQAKLVRVARGRIFDVVVDLRANSATYGRHVALELSAGEGEMLFIPEGFAHGFCTLEKDCEVAYKISNHYSAEHAGGILWNDSDLGISWPQDAAGAVLSEKDAKLPRLRDLDGDIFTA
jgi:dTDP-4-dehydrorhamnose 3,5-epimerase